MRKHSALALLLIPLAILLSCASADKSKADVVGAPSEYQLAPSDIRSEIAPPAFGGKVLVVYFSQGNAARRVAEDIAALYGADIEEIKEARARKTGFFAFMLTGAASSFKTASAIVPSQKDPSRYDAVFVCTPIWSWSLSPPVRSWLKRFAGTLPKAAFITISGDTEPDKVVKDMAKTAKTTPFSFVGFSESDFRPENRAAYIRKLKAAMAGL
jgi:hypothetical protein